MPELPEVESVRVGLESLILNRIIERVEIRWDNIIKRPLSEDNESWTEYLMGQQIKKIGRRGKYLIIYLTDYCLISHLRMEGKYHFYISGDTVPKDLKHVHLIYYFQDGGQLHYHDVRKFGRTERILKQDLDSYFLEKNLGPEPVSSDFKLQEFQMGLSKCHKMIKPTLLEQKLVVGLGNIYVDESLFRAKIHPARLASSLDEEEVNHVYHAIISVLHEAVEAGGSSIRTYLNSLGEAGKFQTQLAVYGRTGLPCRICGTSIEKIKLAQRGTHFCPNCQRLGVENDV